MKLKNKIGCSTNSYHEFDLETALKGIAAAGFKYVELTAVKDYTEHVKPELGKHGLKPMSLSGHSDLTDQSGIELFKKRVDFAHAIGIGVVNTGPGEIETKAGKEKFFDNIFKAAEYAASRDITIALETHGDLLGTGKASAEVIRKIDLPIVRINWSTIYCFNWDYHSGDTVPAITPKQALAIGAQMILISLSS